MLSRLVAFEEEEDVDLAALLAEEVEEEEEEEEGAQEQVLEKSGLVEVLVAAVAAFWQLNLALSE